jgi:lipoprotein-anchoring transpeptidase ErfK/SrfK
MPTTVRPRRPAATHLALLLGICVLTLTSAACTKNVAAPPVDTETPAPLEPSPAPSPFPTFTPTPVLAPNVAIVVGGDLRARAAASTQAPVVRTLRDLERVQIDGAVEGENWLLGAQTWPSTIPPWTRLWYRLTDGTFVYAAFVFVLQPGEVSPLDDARVDKKWIDVNVTTQTATAMVGELAVYAAPVSTGEARFPTPLGSHRIEPDGRLAVERMTASQAGYNLAQASYDVERVLFTQYFDQKGDALHLNYWRPDDVFGRTATSHGCVGLRLHDAQYFWLFAEPGMRVEIHT